MSISNLLDPNTADQAWKSLYAYSANIINSLSTPSLNLVNTSNANVSTPNAGFQTIFCDSDYNNNLTTKTSASNLISLSSALSNFIVGSADDGMKYTTIQSAINASALLPGPQTIIIRPGIYTEDLIIPSNTNLVSLDSVHVGDDYSVQIIGNIDVGSCSINNILINGKVTINNGNPCFNNCGFKNDNAECMYCNNASSLVVVRNCNFTNCLTSYIICDNSASLACIYTTFGIANVQNKNLTVNGGLIVLVNSVVSCNVTTNNTGFAILFNTFMSIGDYPAFTINDGSQILSSNVTIISDQTSSNDFITTNSTGTLIKNNVATLGRTNAQAGIGSFSIPIF